MPYDPNRLLAHTHTHTSCDIQTCQVSDGKQAHPWLSWSAPVITSRCSGRYIPQGAEATPPAKALPASFPVPLASLVLILGPVCFSLLPPYTPGTAPARYCNLTLPRCPFLPFSWQMPKAHMFLHLVPSSQSQGCSLPLLWSPVCTVFPPLHIPAKASAWHRADVQALVTE